MPADLTGQIEENGFTIARVKAGGPADWWPWSRPWWRRWPVIFWRCPASGQATPNLVSKLRFLSIKPKLPWRYTAFTNIWAPAWLKASQFQYIVEISIHLIICDSRFRSNVFQNQADDISVCPQENRFSLMKGEKNGCQSSYYEHFDGNDRSAIRGNGGDADGCDEGNGRQPATDSRIAPVHGHRTECRRHGLRRITHSPPFSYTPPQHNCIHPNTKVQVFILIGMLWHI